MASRWLKICLLFVLFLVLSALARPVQAMTLRLVQSDQKVYKGDVFLLEIRADSQDRAINAVKAGLFFPQDIVKVREISLARSIFRYWPERPAFSNEHGRAALGGGLPAPGFSKNNGLVATVVLEAAAVGTGRAGFLPLSRAYLNDGLGSREPITFTETQITVLEPPVGYRPVVPKPPEPADLVPPRGLVPLITRDKNAYEGKYFAVFEAFDHESGVSHYEVLENSCPAKGQVLEVENADWQDAQSPLTLERQRGRVLLLIKAVDRAGNERVAALEALLCPIYPWWWYLTMLALALFWIFMLWLGRKRHKEGKSLVG